MFRWLEELVDLTVSLKVLRAASRRWADYNLERLSFGKIIIWKHYHLGTLSFGKPHHLRNMFFCQVFLAKPHDGKKDFELNRKINNFVSKYYKA